MSIGKYFALAASNAADEADSEFGDAFVLSVKMDGEFFPGSIYGKAGLIVQPFVRNDFVKHESDELLVFIGTNPDDPENLNAEIEFWIENDKLVFSTTSVLFVPAGAAHGRIKVKNLTKPVFHYTSHTNADTYAASPAQADAAPGTYANHRVEKYAPVDEKLAAAPKGFLARLLWIDGKKLAGAPYMEAVWFRTPNNTGPVVHTHDFDEFIGFIGTDPDRPEELGAEVKFSIGDETMAITKSCLIYIPRGVAHCPLVVPKMDRPVLHFSGGNGGDYIRKGCEK